MYFKSIVTHYKTKLIKLLVQADLHFFYFFVFFNVDMGKDAQICFLLSWWVASENN